MKRIYAHCGDSDFPSEPFPTKRFCRLIAGTVGDETTEDPCTVTELQICISPLKEEWEEELCERDNCNRQEDFLEIGDSAASQFMNWNDELDGSHTDHVQVEGNKKSLKSYFTAVTRRSYSQGLDSIQSQTMDTSEISRAEKSQQLFINPTTMTLCKYGDIDGKMDVDDPYDRHLAACRSGSLVEEPISCHVCLLRLDTSQRKNRSCKFSTCNYCEHEFCRDGCGNECSDCQREFCSFCLDKSFTRNYDCQLCMECR